MRATPPKIDNEVQKTIISKFDDLEFHLHLTPRAQTVFKTSCIGVVDLEKFNYCSRIGD